MIATSIILTILQVAAVVVVVVVALVAAANQKQVRDQRSIDLFDLGKSLGFDEFCPNRDSGFVMGWGFLSPLSHGDDRYALNILRGIYQGQTLFIFDHHYRIGNGKEESHIYGTMLMLVEKQAFPQLLIHHNSGQDRLEAVFGIGNEVKLESAEFSRAFSVRSQDKKFAFDVCNPQMMEFLLQNPDMRLEINGPIISLAFEPLLPVDRIELNLQRLAQIRSLMPDFLFTQNA